MLNVTEFSSRLLIAYDLCINETLSRNRIIDLINSSSSEIINDLLFLFLVIFKRAWFMRLWLCSMMLIRVLLLLMRMLRERDIDIRRCREMRRRHKSLRSLLILRILHILRRRRKRRKRRKRRRWLLLKREYTRHHHTIQTLH